MKDIEEIATLVIDAAVKLHVRLGPGLLETVYSTVMVQSLEQRGLRVDRECHVPFEFEGHRFERGMRIDLLVEQQVIVELKSMETLAPVHFKQILTYLRLLDLPLGLLINFGCATLKQGLHRIVNKYQPLATSPLRINQLANNSLAPSLPQPDPE